jgi:hypothetical protein
MIGTKLKYVYIQDNLMIINNEPYKKHPDLIIFLKPDFKISWVFESKNPPKLKGFSFILDKEILHYRGDEVVLLRLKETFAKHVL